MKDFFQLPVFLRIFLPALVSLGGSILIGAGLLLAQQGDETSPRLETELAPAAFAAPTRVIERVDAPEERLPADRADALTAALDRYHARTGLSVYVVFGDEAAQRAANDLKLEFQTGNTLLLTVLSGDIPGLIFSGPLREKLDVEAVKRQAGKLWQDQKEADFSLQQQVLSVADLVVKAVSTPLPGAEAQGQIAQASAGAQAAATSPGEMQPAAAGTIPDVQQTNATTPQADEEGSLGSEIGRKALNLAIISIVFLLIAAGGAFALLNLYKPVQASPEASRRMAQKRQREEVRSRAERQRMREIEQEKRKEVTERRRKRVQRTMRDTQQLLEAAKKKLTDTIPAPPNRLGGGAGERLDPSQIQGGRAAGETFEQWLWRSLKDFNRLHYGRMTDNLTAERAAALRRHGFFDALDELAAYFKWRTDEAAAEGNDKERKAYEERYGLVLNYAATLKRTSPGLRKHVMGGVESFLRECEEAGLIPKPGMGRPKKG